MADVRTCPQCGSSFEPRREHARFCSAPCRIAWNREKLGDPSGGPSALPWSVTAMGDAARQLSGLAAWDQPRAFVALGEMVWWVTIVDATMVRYHADAYDGVLAAYQCRQRAQINETLGGLRFVRNRMSRDTGCAGFVRPAVRDTFPVTTWTWRSVPPPAAAPRGQAWALARYRAYLAQLCGHAVGETFERATAFLARAAAAASVTEETPAGIPFPATPVSTG